MLLLLKPQADFIIVNKLALVGLGHAFPDGCAEACGFFQQAQSGILYQTLGVHTGMRRDLGKLRFLVGSEMNFHGVTNRLAQVSAQEKEMGPEHLVNCRMSGSIWHRLNGHLRVAFEIASQEWYSPPASSANGASILLGRGDAVLLCQREYAQDAMDGGLAFSSIWLGTTRE